MSIAILQNQRGKMLVPQLRFPEFSEEWEITPLINLTINGFSNGAFNDPKKVGSGYRIINVKDMYIDGTINIDTLNRVAIDEKEFSKNRVEYGDIFFTRSSLVKEGIAHSNINLNTVDDLTFDGHLIRMRPKKNHSPVFLYYNFATQSARQQFIERGKTTTMTTIGQEDIAKVKISYPTLSEQQKIASFLSAVDEKIQQLSRKKELLEQYKKGVMQQLFSGKLRFKDENGKDYTDWEEKNISSVCKRSSGKSKSENITDDGENIIVDMGSISRDCKLIGNKRTNCQDDYLETNELVMVKDDIGGGNIIGKVVMIPFNNKYVCGDHVYRLKVVNGDVSFIYFAINSYEVNKSFRRKANGTAQIGINNRTVDEQKIPFPCFAEQQKIAKFLSSIDVKIESTSQQINQMQSFKKGLLQQLFV